MQRGYQPLIIYRMQSDARFIEHIKHTGQARTDLRGKPDALGLTAGKRAALAIQRQVTKADFGKKFQPLQYLALQIRAECLLQFR